MVSACLKVHVVISVFVMRSVTAFVHVVTLLLVQRGVVMMTASASVNVVALLLVVVVMVMPVALVILTRYKKLHIRRSKEGSRREATERNRRNRVKGLHTLLHDGQSSSSCHHHCAKSERD